RPPGQSLSPRPGNPHPPSGASSPPDNKRRTMFPSEHSNGYGLLSSDNADIHGTHYSVHSETHIAVPHPVFLFSVSHPGSACHSARRPGCSPSASGSPAIRRSSPHSLHPQREFRKGNPPAAGIKSAAADSGKTSQPSVVTLLVH